MNGLNNQVNSQLRSLTEHHQHHKLVEHHSGWSFMEVPEEWTRKQQMTNGSRYVTDELREQDDLLLTAESKSKSIEYALFCSLRDRVRQHANKLATIASKVAAIDVLQCFASTARQRSWVKPVLTEGRKMMLSQARHPVLEVQQGFVPNDIVMDDKRRFLLITGPNISFFETAASFGGFNSTVGA